MLRFIEFCVSATQYLLFSVLVRGVSQLSVTSSGVNQDNITFVCHYAERVILYVKVHTHTCMYSTSPASSLRADVPPTPPPLALHPRSNRRSHIGVWPHHPPPYLLP